MDFKAMKNSAIRTARAAVVIGATEAVIFGLTVAPALAQRADNGGGGDAPFAAGVGIGLNWVQFLGAAIAVFAFIGGCIALFMRQVMVAGGAFLFVLIGAALIARSGEIITRLTSLGFA
jgi:hypothetical protein